MGAAVKNCYAAYEKLVKGDKTMSYEDKEIIYKNAGYSMEDRVADLLERMTIGEKARQLDQYMGTSFVDRTHPAHVTVMHRDGKIDRKKLEEQIGSEGAGCIHDLYGEAAAANELQRYFVENTRLGIPVLFSEEALHGLLKPGCTIFPHAITQAASFDEEVALNIGKCIAAESRSFGICETFGPVLDLSRDPRWGRMEENYGEDTLLAARMGTAMVKGLQGEDICSCGSIIAEPKHFAVHGIPEGGLNMSPANMGRHDIESDYLPVFEAAFCEGGAINAMCSYNSIDGQPCSSNRELLTGVLRDRFGMKGFVRSDLGAVARLHKNHRTAASEKEAIRQALTAGVDMQYYDFSHEFFQRSIVEMVCNGELQEAELDQAVKRVLWVKFKLGLFEHPYVEESYAESIVRCAEHLRIAHETALKGICLLKNCNGLLPLPRTALSIAVIGPSADAPRFGDYSPAVEGFEPVALLAGIKNMVSPATVVRYAKGTGILEDELDYIPDCNLIAEDGEKGLLGEYYETADFSGEPLFTRLDPQIHFNWIIAKPDERLPEKGFSVRWKGKLAVKKGFEGRLGFLTQDQVRLYVNGELIIDRWPAEVNEGQTSVPFLFQKNTCYELMVEYAKTNNGAQVLLGWSNGETEMEEAVKLVSESQVAIVALGDSDKTCGEGIDRRELGLPGRQQELLKALKKTGVPLVLVLLNGRAMTLEWEHQNMDAIVEAWYGGEKGGQAIAEVLFGAYNPAGRLPVSFPKALGQLPVYYSRKRGGNAAYIEGNNKALYPFGYGLSYTSFVYQGLKLSSGSYEIKKGQALDISFDVINTGRMDGEEVVQMYISDHFSSVVLPEKLLKGFQRVYLKVGEKRKVRFSIGFHELKLLNRDYQWVVEKGSFTVFLAASSEDLRLQADFDAV